METTSISSSNLSLLSISIKAPTGSLGSANSIKTESMGKDGEYRVLAKGSTTSPKWKIDQHPHWKKLRENKTAITTLRSKYTVSDGSRGCYLIPTSKIPSFFEELDALLTERKQMAIEMANIWDSEVVPTAREKIGADFYDRHVARKMYLADTVADRFDVEYSFTSIESLKPQELNFENLPKEIIDKYEVAAEKVVKDRYKNVVDVIIKETIELCDDVKSGSLETGKRKNGAIRGILDILDRVDNFDEFISKEVKAKVHQAKSYLTGVDIKDMNNEKSNERLAVKAKFDELRKSLIQNSKDEKLTLDKSVQY